MRYLIIVALIALLGTAVAFADECDPVTCTPTPSATPTETATPTITPTPSDTPTPTPDVEIVITLPPPDVGQPGQPAIFSLRADAGQFMKVLLLFGIFTLTLIRILLSLFGRI